MLSARTQNGMSHLVAGFFLVCIRQAKGDRSVHTVRMGAARRLGGAASRLPSPVGSVGGWLACLAPLSEPASCDAGPSPSRGDAPDGISIERLGHPEVPIGSSGDGCRHVS
jgi:hypothetical protein